MISNLSTYLSVARDSLRNAKRFTTANRRPRSDGKSGFIISYDPKQKAFKQSLIAIVFSGIYLEALLYIEGTKRIGRSKFLKIKEPFYENKLLALGIPDKSLLDDCKRFRKSRNDLVHEKAVDVLTPTAELRFAQKEAQHAVDLILRVTKMIQKEHSKI